MKGMDGFTERVFLMSICYKIVAYGSTHILPSRGKCFGEHMFVDGWTYFVNQHGVSFRFSDKLGLQIWKKRTTLWKTKVEGGGGKCVSFHFKESQFVPPSFGMKMLCYIL